MSFLFSQEVVSHRRKVVPYALLLPPVQEQCCNLAVVGGPEKEAGTFITELYVGSK